MAVNSIEAKAAIFLMTIMISASAFFLKEIYHETRSNANRLTVIESTLIERSVVVEKMAILEYKVSELEKKYLK